MTDKSDFLNEVLLLEPKIYSDDRGFFYESFNKDVLLKQHGVNIDIKQINVSSSVKNVLRGLHMQKHPFGQGKLVSVVQGEIFDVAVDLRPNSKSYLKYKTEILSKENKNSFWIPKGFAHGFFVLSDNAIVSYCVDSPYNKDSEITVMWNDPMLNIDWPIHNENLPILSPKDKEGFLIKDLIL
jgi:dTDP-4-dehydrorhamnose 3,5-epimerase